MYCPISSRVGRPLRRIPEHEQLRNVRATTRLSPHERTSKDRLWRCLSNKRWGRKMA
jgi:hypothetical protein